MDSDKIIPFRFFDDRPYLRPIVTDLVLRFDNCLSPERLRSSFEQLLSVGKWRQLGARIRLDVSLFFENPEAESLWRSSTGNGQAAISRT
jgi:hypothetical protein